MKLSVKLTKLIYVFCLLIVTFPLKSQNKEKVQIKWYVQLSNDEDDPYTLSLNEHVENYNNSQDSIELIIDPCYVGCSFDATDSLLLKIQEGNPPDITTLNYSELWEHLMDIKPYLSGYNLSNVDSTYFFKHEYNDSLLYLSFSICHNMLFYNKSMFDSLDIPYPPAEYGELYNGTDVWDMDKLEEVAMLLTMDANGNNAYDEEFNPDTIVQYGYHWRYSNGMAFIKPFGQPQIVNEDCEVSIPYQTRLGYSWINEGTWNKHFILPGEENENLNFDPLGSGKVGMLITGSYYVEELDSLPFEWDIAATPEYNGNTNIAWNTSSFGILNTCEHPKEALEVIFAITNIIELYGTTIPTMKNLRTGVRDSLLSKYPDINWQVLDNTSDLIQPDESTGDALYYNMAAWRLANDMRDYLQYDPYADVNGSLDFYFIPRWEIIFADACTSNPPTGVDELANDQSTVEPDNICKVYPNLLCSNTTFFFNIPHRGMVKLIVYNSNGQKIETLIEQSFQQGEYEFIWTTHNLPAGMYLARFELDDYYEIEKLICIR
ncbi:MAG: extracellular solute-binding protein [Bacteroidales bacterium]|nr:extracellular solute-binding protein [Bacteroidales bacterium]